MKILATSKATILLAIGEENVVPCDARPQETPRAGGQENRCAGGISECFDDGTHPADKSKKYEDTRSLCDYDAYFPNFEFQDRGGAARLFEAPDAEYPVIIESYALSSQYERLAPCRLPTPVFSLALNGEGFHGQGGRPWAAGKGNLHLCARLPLQTAEASPIYRLIPSLAAVRSLGGGFGLKWPNDIVSGDPRHKVGGSLTAVLPQDRALLLGIGVNLSRAPKISMRDGVCAAACYPHAFDFNDQSRIHRWVARAAMHEVTAVYEESLRAPQKLIEEYRSRLLGIGHHVMLIDARTDAVVASGIFSDIDEEFAVCLSGHATHYRDVRMRFSDGDNTHTRYISP